MEALRRLPDEMLPYAERMFAWFPEVMVTLGNPKLGDAYELPPSPSVQMRLKETADCKLVVIRLHRRARKSRQPSSTVSPGDQDAGYEAEDCESPFSKSRALAAQRGEDCESPFSKSRTLAAQRGEDCESPFSKSRVLAAQRFVATDPASTPDFDGERQSSHGSGAAGQPGPASGEQHAASKPARAEAAEVTQVVVLDEAQSSVDNTHDGAVALARAAPPPDVSLGSTAPAHGAGAGACQQEQEGSRQEACGDGDQRAEEGDDGLEGEPAVDEACEPRVSRTPSKEPTAQQAEAAAPEAAPSEGKPATP